MFTLLFEGAMFFTQWSLLPQEMPVEERSSEQPPEMLIQNASPESDKQ
jgi:hypothetical protein